jgi:hypothetical protein
VGSLAFRIRLDGKLVLFTGGFPLGGSPDGGPGRLAGAAGQKAVLLDYLASVSRLTDPKPDLWLPAHPVDGRNANLYDGDWQEIVDESLRSGNRLLRPLVRPPQS